MWYFSFVNACLITRLFLLTVFWVCYSYLYKSTQWYDDAVSYCEVAGHYRGSIEYRQFKITFRQRCNNDVVTAVSLDCT